MDLKEASALLVKIESDDSLKSFLTGVLLSEYKDFKRVERLDSKRTVKAKIDWPEVPHRRKFQKHNYAVLLEKAYKLLKESGGLTVADFKREFPHSAPAGIANRLLKRFPNVSRRLEGKKYVYFFVKES